MKITKRYLLFRYSILLSMALSFSAFAQDDGVTYDDEAAGADAGIVNYSDDIAAGTADDEVSEEAAPADEVSAADEDPFAMEATVNTNGESSAKVKGGAPVKVSDPDRAKRKSWEWGAIRHHSSWTGTTGLMDVKEAGSADAGTFGLGLNAGFFKYHDYLVYGDENTQSSGNLNLRVTPFKFLELHAALNALANTNNKEYPSLFQTIGDFTFGVKGFYSPIKMMTIGLDAYVAFLNSVGDTSMDFSGTSFGFDALATFDFTELSEKAPIRAHIMAGYYFDNAYNLISDIETQREGCGTDSDGDGLVEYEGCLSPVERTALGIDRNDQVKIGIGLDALLPYVSPMFEYNIDIPVNRQGFTCPQIPGSFDSCMADTGAKGMRQWLNAGVRILPPVEDLAIDLGAEIGLSGYAPSVHELAAQEPYVVKIGVSYQFDPFPEKTECKEPVEGLAPAVVPAPVAEAEPSGSVLAGMVHAAGDETAPVGGAVINYENYEFNPQVTTDGGRFNSYNLPSGSAQFKISAPGYEDGTFTVEMPESGVVQQFFPLTPAPKKGVITIIVVDEKSKPIKGVDVKLSGALSGTFTSDEEGKILAEADAGKVTVTVDSESYLYKQMEAEVVNDTNTRLEFQLKAKPKKSLVIVKKNMINIKKKIHFKVGSDEIDSSSFDLMDEIADIIVRNPQITSIEVQGHTDDRGARTFNIDLSQKRAESVVNYLVTAGVARGRLSAKGFGPDKPVAPNITSTGRAKNRRVEFHILDENQ
ncbi:MAG: OmpA family protein [Deltaproteobacteria bacterium]|nr:OmpA family protein [Deltaproteobacteria bacterium]